MFVKHTKNLLFFSTFFFGVLFFSYQTRAAEVNPGDVIKSKNSPGVYYYADDGKRYLFPNEKIYLSWYNDFNDVVTLTDEELAAIPFAGRNVVYRAGTYLIKITTDPKVYAVEPGGVLRWVKTEDIAKELWGKNWTKRVHDLSDAFFSNYTEGKTISSATYPIGSFVKDGNDTFYIHQEGKRKKLTTEAVTTNRIRSEFVSSKKLDTYAKETDIASYQGSIADIFYGDGINVSSSGLGVRLAVQLSENSPKEGVVVADTNPDDGAQALAELARLDMTAGSDGDIVLTRLLVHQTGFSLSSDLSKVYLSVQGSEVAEAILYSDKTILFESAAGLFKVEKNTTKSVSIIANVTNGVVAGKSFIVGIDSVADISTSSDAVISGTFPLYGATMKMQTLSDLGTATIEQISNPNLVELGDTDAEIYRVRVLAQTHDILVSRFRITIIGSIGQTDLKNFRLYYGEGKQLGTAVSVVDGNGRVAFDFASAPVKIVAGGEKNLYVLAKVYAGAGRDFRVSLENISDVVIQDDEYSVYIKPNKSDTFTPIRPSAVTYVSSGQIEVTRRDQEDQVALESSSTIGIFDLKAVGQGSRVSTLKITPLLTSSDTNKEAPTDIKDVRLYIDGVEIGSAQSMENSKVYEYLLSNQLSIEVDKTKAVKIVATILSTDTASHVLAIGDFVQFKFSEFSTQGTTTMTPVTLKNFQTEKLEVTSPIIKVFATTGEFPNASASKPSGGIGDGNVLVAKFAIEAGDLKGLTIKQITLKDNGVQDWAGEFSEVVIVLEGKSVKEENYLAHSAAPSTNTGTTYTFNLTKEIRISKDGRYDFEVYAKKIKDTATTLTEYVAVVFDSIVYQIDEVAKDSSYTTDKNGQKIYLES